MTDETLTERLVRGMNLTGTWVPLTQAQADALEFPDQTTRQVYQLPDWWDGDDIPDVAAEVCVLERALELAARDADATKDAGADMSFPEACEYSRHDLTPEYYIAQARDELDK